MELLTSVYDTLTSGMLVYLLLILAAVAFLKEMLKLEGSIVRWVSFGVGVFFGGLQVVKYFWPDSGAIVEAVFFILSIGLFASGFYDLGREIKA